MKIFYKDGENILKHLIKVGEKWDAQHFNSQTLNSIFKNIDDGDGIASDTEINTLKEIFDNYSKTKVCDNSEAPPLDEIDLQVILENIKHNTIKKAEITTNSTLTDEIIKELSESLLFFNVDKTKKLDKLIYQIDHNEINKMLYSENEIFNPDDIYNLLIVISTSNCINKEKKAEYIKKLKDALLEHASSKGIYTEDLSEAFDKEITKQLENGNSFRFYTEFFQTFLTQLFKRVPTEAQEDFNINANGLIDNNIKQGRTGDCWLIATIIALSKEPKGQQILQESLTYNEDGSVTVNLKGVNKSYTITKEEIISATDLSTETLMLEQ